MKHHMPILKEKDVINYSIEQVYIIISDVESYHKFLPWCGGAKIKEKIDAHTFTAELIIKFAMFCKSYVSKVTLSPPRDKHAAVNAEMISGPFRYLFTSWQLTSLDAKSTRIHFSIDFEFSSPLLSKLASGMLLKANDKIMLAFKQRADALFSNDS